MGVKNRLPGNMNGRKRGRWPSVGLLLGGLLMAVSVSGCTGSKKQTATDDAVILNNETAISQEQENLRPEKDVIHDLIYGFNARKDGDYSELLQELSSVNPDKALRWTRICDTWGHAYKDGYVNLNRLPDNLPGDDSLCLVVLGYGLNPDGTMREELIGRLTVAYDCALQYPNAYILVTGGGTATNNKQVTEADAMAAWLLEAGIDCNRIIIENKSLNTLDNAANSLVILKSDYPSVSKLAIISSDYHIPWGVVNYEAVIQYDAGIIDGVLNPMYEIVSNAGYVPEDNKYGFESIDSCQKSQLWELERRN